jgi:glycosyltransferase involved in cell wall biosynthesis
MDSPDLRTLKEIAGGKNPRRIFICSAVTEHSLIDQLVQSLQAAGLRAEVLAGISSSSYRKSGVISRIRSRLFIYLIYPLKLAWFSFTSKSSVFIATTNPFLAPFAIALFKRPNAVLITWMFDLYPECLVVHGSTPRGSFLFNFILRLMRFTVAKSNSVVYLGARLKSFGDATYGGGDRSTNIPIGSGFPAASVQRLPSTEILFSYTGNIGRLHDVESLAEAIRTIPAEPHRNFLRFVFAGFGSGYARLRSLLEGFLNSAVTVEFKQNLSDAEWSVLLRTAEIAIVTMREGAENVLIPSKTFSSLSAGQAILAVAPSSSDLADTIRLHECGWLFEPGDNQKLTSLFLSIANGDENLSGKQKNAVAAAECYTPDRLVKNWLNLNLHI